ncbi:hypothetical protein C4K18_5692 [Pseudomonas chlororaphis subsp. aurantiaca]|nr:hypothetical protein C4K18_5692 [Pseudomonas chlororaphis subsp. aurantiaca]
MIDARQPAPDGVSPSGLFVGDDCCSRCRAREAAIEVGGIPTQPSQI